MFGFHSSGAPEYCVAVCCLCVRAIGVCWIWAYDGVGVECASHRRYLCICYIHLVVSHSSTSGIRCMCNGYTISVVFGFSSVRTCWENQCASSYVWVHIIIDGTVTTVIISFIILRVFFCSVCVVNVNPIQTVVFGVILITISTSITSYYAGLFWRNVRSGLSGIYIIDTIWSDSNQKLFFCVAYLLSSSIRISDKYNNFRAKLMDSIFHNYNSFCCCFVCRNKFIGIWFEQKKLEKKNET